MGMDKNKESRTWNLNDLHEIGCLDSVHLAAKHGVWVMQLDLNPMVVVALWQYGKTLTISTHTHTHTHYPQKKCN